MISLLTLFITLGKRWRNSKTGPTKWQLKTESRWRKKSKCWNNFQIRTGKSGIVFKSILILQLLVNLLGWTRFETKIWRFGDGKKSARCGARRIKKPNIQMSKGIPKWYTIWILESKFLFPDTIWRIFREIDP